MNKVFQVASQKVDLIAELGTNHLILFQIQIIDGEQANPFFPLKDQRQHFVSRLFLVVVHRHNIFVEHLLIGFFPQKHVEDDQLFLVGGGKNFVALLV